MFHLQPQNHQDVTVTPLLIGTVVPSLIRATMEKEIATRIMNVQEPFDVDPTTAYGTTQSREATGQM